MSELAQLKTAILQPVDMMWNKIIDSIPQLICVVVILIVGLIISALIKRVVIRFLKLARLDSISDKTGIANILLKGDIHLTVSEIIGTMAYWTMVLVVVLMAVNALNLDAIARLLESVILYIPHVIAAVFILVLGIFLASILSATVRTTTANYGMTQAKTLGKLTQMIVIVFTVVQALSQLNLDVRIFNLIIQATVAALALGVGLAIGLGGKDIAAKYIQKLIDSFKK